MNRSKIVFNSTSATTLFDHINIYTQAHGYSINRLWYVRGWFRITYYAELLPPKPPPPPPPPRLEINIGPVSNRISLEPKVKLKFSIGPVSNR